MPPLIGLDALMWLLSRRRDIDDLTGHRIEPRINILYIAMSVIEY